MTNSIHSSVPVRAMFSSHRRLDASSYLHDGKGLRDRFSLLPADKCKMLGELSDQIMQPARTGTYPALPGEGYPFLSAGQMFEAHPVVRKWAAKPFVKNEPSREVTPEQILMSCSGDVGRVTVVYPHHENIMVTHDLLRITIAEPVTRMWIYAWLKTPIAKSIAGAMEYGHMIKHIDVASASTIPVPLPDGYRKIGEKALTAIRLRRESLKKANDAEKVLDNLLRGDGEAAKDESWRSMNIADIFHGRLRLDASYYSSDGITEAERTVHKWPISRLGDLFESIADRPRFTRYFSDGTGTPYCSADEIFDVNAPFTKKIYAGLVPDKESLTLHEGMMVMACSGQTYGLLGRVRILSKNFEGVIGTHDLIRLQHPQNISATYVLTFLNSLKYGAPLVKRNAYGTSIPHLDAADIKSVPVPRLGEANEQMIAEIMQESVQLSDKADAKETEAVNEAQQAATALID